MLDFKFNGVKTYEQAITTLFFWNLSDHYVVKRNM